jgi:hypothetical protein
LREHAANALGIAEGDEPAVEARVAGRYSVARLAEPAEIVPPEKLDARRVDRRAHGHRVPRAPRPPAGERRRRLLDHDRAASEDTVDPVRRILAVDVEAPLARELARDTPASAG